MARRCVNGSGAPDIASYDRFLPQEIDQGHGRHGRTDYCSGMSFHFVCDTIPSIVFQVSFKKNENNENIVLLFIYFMLFRRREGIKLFSLIFPRLILLITKRLLANRKKYCET